MVLQRLKVTTDGEGLYEITDLVVEELGKLLPSSGSSGIFYLFIPHVSSALMISEAYDPSAKGDVESFIKHLAPRNLPFITHTLEGPDDSPSHMKSAILHQHLALPVEKGELLLGQWQGIFLAEFRDRRYNRTLMLKFLEG